MIDDVWEQLLQLNHHWLMRRTLEGLSLDQTVFELYLEHIEEEMFIVAGHRLADRRGIACLRIDVPDAKPATILVFGHDLDDARERVIEYYQSQEAAASYAFDDC